MPCHNTADVQLALATRSVRVNYKTSTGIEVGNERVEAPKKALEIQESQLVRIPVGYEIESISAIVNNTVTVIVTPIVTTKEVKVNYLFNGSKIGDEIVSVPADATTVDQSLMNIPEDYKFVSVTNITSHNTADVQLEKVADPENPTDPDSKPADPDSKPADPDSKPVDPDSKPEIKPEDDNKSDSDAKAPESSASNTATKASSDQAAAASAPKTGDESHLLPWALVMMSAAAVMVVISKMKKSK